MLPKNNNLISYKNDSIYKNNNVKNIKNSSKLITPKNSQKNKSKLNKSLLRNALLNPPTQKINKINKKINLNKNCFFNSEVQNSGFPTNNCKNNEIKSNNVTNNICIIIKTENQGQNEKDGINELNYNFGYYDSLRNSKYSHNQSSTSIDNINYPNVKHNIFNSQKKESDNIKLKKYNKSFISNKSNKKNENNIKSKNNNIKYNNPKKTNTLTNKGNRKIKPKINEIDVGKNNKKNIFKNKNNSIINTKKYSKRNKIKNVKNSYIDSSSDKNDSYSKRKIYTDLYDKNNEFNINNVNNMIYPQSNKNKNSLGLTFKESIQQKRKLLGIHLNLKEKKDVNKLSIDYDKQRQEIEKKILLSDEMAKNERKIIDYKSKKNQNQNISSGDIFINPIESYHDINNKKNNDKLNDIKFDSIFNNEHNISKIDISYVQTDCNKDEIKNYINLLKLSKTSTHKNNAKKIKIQYKNSNKKNKKYNQNFGYKKSINDSSKNSINKLSSNNSGILNSKSCMDIFIKESKIKRNINTILKDIKKIIDREKSNNKDTNKSQKKYRITSTPRDETLLIKDNEDGKTLHCIKRLSKEKVQNYIEIKPKKTDENENESPIKITDYICNIKNIKKQKKVQKYKNMEIKVPKSEISVLRRIKSKINNYKKSQKRYRNNKFIKFRQAKSFSFFNIKKDRDIVNEYKIKRINSLKINNDNLIFLKFKFY